MKSEVAPATLGGHCQAAGEMLPIPARLFLSRFERQLHLFGADSEWQHLSEGLTLRAQLGIYFNGW